MTADTAQNCEDCGKPLDRMGVHAQTCTATATAQIVNDMSRFVIVELPAPASHDERKAIAARIANAISPQPDTAPSPSPERVRELIEQQTRQISFYESADSRLFEPMVARCKDTIAALERLQTFGRALTGISTCSTCEVCRNVALKALK